MKRTSFTIAVTGCLIMGLVAVADAIDQTKTGGTPAVNLQNQFNPSTLPGQGTAPSFGAQNDPFLPNDIYNPFPSLPGLTPNNNGMAFPMMMRTNSTAPFVSFPRSPHTFHLEPSSLQQAHCVGGWECVRKIPRSVFAFMTFSEMQPRFVRGLSEMI